MNLSKTLIQLVSYKWFTLKTQVYPNPWNNRQMGLGKELLSNIESPYYSDNCLHIFINIWLCILRSYWSNKFSVMKFLLKYIICSLRYEIVSYILSSYRKFCKNKKVSVKTFLSSKLTAILSIDNSYSAVAVMNVFFELSKVQVLLAVVLLWWPW